MREPGVKRRAVSNRRLIILAAAILSLSGVVALGGTTVASAQSGSCGVVVQEGENIQDAINSSATGATICVEDGTYEEALTVDVEGLTLTAADGASPVLDGNETLATAIHVDGADDVVIEGFNVTRYGGANVHAESAANLTVRDAEMSHDEYASDGAGINLTYSPDALVRDTHISTLEYGVYATGSDGVVVDNLTATGNSGEHDSSGVYAVNSTGVTVADSNLSANDYGLRLSSDAHDLVFENNTVLDNGHGVLIYETDNVSITNNTILATGDEGVQIGESVDAVVRGNDIEGTYRDPAVLIDRNSHRAVVVDNAVSEADDEGIRVENSDNLTISRNVVENNSRYQGRDSGVHLLNSNGSTLADNEIRDSGIHGIFLDWMEDGTVYGPIADVVVENNTISGHETGMELDRSVNATVTDNAFETGVIFDGGDLQHFDHTFANNTVAGDPLVYANGVDDPGVPADAAQVIVVNSTNVSLADRTFENVAAGVQIAYSDGTVVENTTLSSMTGDPFFRAGAITAWGSSNVTLSGVDVEGSDGYGPILRNSQNPRIEHTTVNATVRQGIWLLGTTDAVLSDVDVSNSEDENGIHLESGSHNATISGSNVTGHERAGIMLQDSDGATVSDTSASGNGRGISLYVAADVLVTGNDVIDNENLGVGPRHGADANENVTIHANVVTGNGEGIETGNSATGVRITDNVVTQSSGIGIIGHVGLVRNNTVTDSGEDGVTAGSGAVIRDNTITDSTEHGIEASGGDLLNNTVADNGMDGIRADGFEDDTIANNTVSGHAVGLRFVESTGATVANNSFESGVALVTSSSGDVTHYDHAFADNTVDGAPLSYTFGGDDPTIPADAGQVIVADATNVSIEDVDFTGVTTPIQIAYSDGVSVENASVTDASDDGIRVEFSQNVTLNATTVAGSGGHGLYLGEVGPINVTESEFSANGEHGLWVELVDSPQRSTFSNSTIGANTDGIHFEQYTDVINLTVGDNVIRDNDRGIFVATEIENVRIEGNSFVANDIGIEYDLTYGPPTLDARENWWGDASGPSGGATDAVNASVTADGSGDSIELHYDEDSSVRFFPWLTAAPVETATFDVTNAAVNPTSVEEGDSVTVTADVTNTGNATETYTAPLEINGTEEATASEPIDPGATEQVTFTHAFDDAGVYDVTIDGLAAGTVTVEEPPEPEANLDVTNAAANATTVEEGDSVTVTADVANTGNATGSDVASLEIDGTVEATTNVLVDAGATEQVTFTHTFPDAGSYAVSVDGVSAGTVTVESSGGDGTGSAGGGGGAGSTGGGGTGSTGDGSAESTVPDSEPDTDVSIDDTDEGATAEITDATANEPVTIPLAGTQPTTEVDLTALEVTTSADADFEVSVEASEEPPADGGALPPDAEAMVYLDVEHDLEDDQIGGAAFEFTVSTEELEARGLDPEDVVLYHQADGSWTERETTVLDDSGDSVSLRSEVPHFSWFAVAATSPSSDGEEARDDASDSGTAAGTSAGGDEEPADDGSLGFGAEGTIIAVGSIVVLLTIAILARRQR